MGKKRVMLLCLSCLGPGRPEETYVYEFREKTYELHGYMTNEAPVKRVIDQLHEEQSRLDRVVMICSEQTLEEKVGSWRPPVGFWTDPKYEKLRERRMRNGCRVVDMTHAAYFEEAMQEYSLERSPGVYEAAPIEFASVQISDFAQEQLVVRAVAEAAEKVEKGYENEEIELFIDFNGGPRNVAFLLLEAANLLAVRNARVRDITSMDYENKREGKIPIRNMTAVFDSMDLVSGIHEYVNYGRIRMLKEYFRTCRNQKIHILLRTLENFANNLQLCLIDYVMNNKEMVRRELEEYRQNRENQNPSDARELMFAFVAQDILEECRKLLEGELPEMIQWCVEKDFILQALTLYLERVPRFLWEKGIFCPTSEERTDYMDWQLGCECGDQDDRTVEIYDRKYRTKDERYCWMVYYLLEPCGAGDTDDSKRKSSEQAADKAVDKVVDKVVDKAGGRRPEAVREKKSAEAIADRLTGFLSTGRAESTWPVEKLYSLLTEYFEIWNQCKGGEKGTAAMSDEGGLWEYEEMSEMLKKAADSLREK